MYPTAYQSLHCVMSGLAYLLKAPLVPAGSPVVNALFRQRGAIENILRAALALPPNNFLGLEHKVTHHTHFFMCVIPLIVFGYFIIV